MTDKVDHFGWIVVLRGPKLCRVNGFTSYDAAKAFAKAVFAGTDEYPVGSVRNIDVAEVEDRAQISGRLEWQETRY